MKAKLQVVPESSYREYRGYDKDSTERVYVTYYHLYVVKNKKTKLIATYMTRDQAETQKRLILKQARGSLADGLKSTYRDYSKQIAEIKKEQDKEIKELKKDILYAKKLMGVEHSYE